MRQVIELNTLDLKLQGDGKELRLPVNPSEIRFQFEKQRQTVNIINIGEVDFTSGQRIQEISFSSFFPQEYDSSYCRFPSIPNPLQAMQMLTDWTVSGQPVSFIAGSIYNGQVLVSARNIIIKGGEPGDVYYDLSLRSWREIKIRKANESQNTRSNNKTSSRPDTSSTSSNGSGSESSSTYIYVVRPGDCLQTIAKQLFGDYRRWSEIYEANKDIIDNPDRINTGQKLVIENGS